MNSKKKQYAIYGVIIAAVIGLIVFAKVRPEGPGEFDAFADCLTEKKAVFYGAFWCPHCQDQKAMFGRSAKRLPYVECSTPDGQSQNQTCTDKKVESYPTWEFADGSRETGTLSMSRLAEKTGCSI